MSSGFQPSKIQKLFPYPENEITVHDDEKSFPELRKYDNR